MKRLLFSLILLAVIAVPVLIIAKNASNKKAEMAGAEKDAFVTIVTDMGTMKVKLYKETPLHRDNFVKLAKQGYYDSLMFHRVIKGFMIQGGDPDSKRAAAGAQLGSGGPGYTIPAEFSPNIIHKKGALAAARNNNPKKESSGCQFYIVQGRGSVSGQELDRVEMSKAPFKYTDAQRKTYAAVGGTPQLDQDYTVFGEVIEGMDVIDKIANTPTAPGDRPLKDVRMKMTVNPN